MAHLRRSHRWQLTIKLVLILLGGLIAATAQFPLPIADGAKMTIGLIGAGMAFVGGTLLLAIERDYVDLMLEAREAVSEWRSGEEALAASREEASQLRLNVVEEREQLITYNLVLQFWDKARSLADTPLDARLEYFLIRAAPRLVTSLRLGGDHSWTFSVFRKQRVGKQIRMVRVASCWKERSSEGEDRRSWALGKGWTGAAWLRGDQRDKDPFVIEADAGSLEARARYDVDHQEEADDYERFRSVASIPFEIPGHAKTFGVATVTSSRPGVFGVEPNSVPLRNFNAINNFVRLVASLASIADSPP